MVINSLRNFIEILEKAGELVRIKEFVDPVLEISEITDRVSKSKDGGKALLFENNGTNFPILINAFGSEKRIKLALGIQDLDAIGHDLDLFFKKMSSPKKGLIEKIKILPELARIAGYMPRSSKRKAKSQEVVNFEPNLDALPILKCWPADGGRFVTLPLVITKDPITGIRNIGMYRMHVFDKNTTGMHWHKHKVGARHYSEYKKLDKKMPIAVALGGDPIITYSATAPLPDNIDELMLAGFLRKQSVKLVKAITQDIEVPADADFVIEGFVDPKEEMVLEGPFGDHTGFYSLADYYPKFHITCITHRKDAVYPTTIVGIPPQEDAWLGKATERIFLAPIRMTMIPELVDMELPYYGVAHNLCLISIKKEFSGQALKVTNSLWGAGQMMFNKSMIVVDQDINIHDYQKVATAFLENVNPLYDIHFSMGPLDILDHSSSKFAYGSKICIDATRKFPEELGEKEKFTISKLKLPDLNLLKDEFGFIIDLSLVVSDGKTCVLFITLEKGDDIGVLEIAEKIYKSEYLAGVKMIVCFDKEVNISDIPSSIWIVTNNIDPRRDSSILCEEGKPACIIIDGTKKTGKSDNFKRDWPNIVISDDKTIEKIDSIWEKLNLGTFINSPSKYYKPLVPNAGAVQKKHDMFD